MHARCVRVFVLDGISMTFHHLNRYGLKISPRNMNVCKWLEQRVHYKTLTNFRENPLPVSRSIDFAFDIGD